MDQEGDQDQGTWIKKTSDLDAAIDGELPEAPETLGGDAENLDSRVAGDDQVQVGGRGEVTLGGKTVTTVTTVTTVASVTTVTACIADCAQYRVAGVDRRGVRGDHVIVSHPDSSPASL